MALDRKKLAAELDGANADSLIEFLLDTLDAGAEVAKRTGMPVTEFVELAIRRWSEVHGMQLNVLEVEEKAPGVVDTLSIMRPKWSEN